MKVENHHFSSGTITIRPHQINDAEPCYEAVRESIDELMPWMFWCHNNISLHEIREWIESRPQEWEDGKGYHFAIIDSDQGTFIGNGGIDNIDVRNKVAELGYWVRTSQTNHGIATSASKLIINFAFNSLKLNRIEIVIATGNKISQRVAEKLDAKKEGLLRQRLTVRDTVYDAYLFSLILDDLA